MNLLGLDFDGVLHRASDRVFLNFRPYMPAWEMELALKAQSRFVWAPLLSGLVQGTDTAIVIHSTWRKQFDDSTMKSFLPPELACRVICMDGQIPHRATLASDDYLSAAIDLISPDSVCVIDDRPQFFYGGKVKHWIANNHGQFIWCQPEIGMRDEHAQQEVANWSRQDHRRDRMPIPTC